MYRYLLLTGWLGLGLAIGCSQQQPTKVEVADVQPIAKGDKEVAKADGAEKTKAQEKYEANLRLGLDLIADRKFSEALLVLETAQVLHDTDEVKSEIERVKSLMVQQKAADQTASDIQAILKDGNAEEASKLATDALQQFGAGDNAPKLVLLKQQADALRAQGFEDMGERKTFFVQQAEGAMKDQNLRAAAVAFSQALEIGDDQVLRAKYDEIQGRLDQYDNGRKKATELRQDAYQLEDALVFLNDAAKAWDTPEIRQDIAATHVALTRRRDRVGVADFETRGEIGIPLAGRTLAEELLPHFRAKYDVVERAQLSKVIDELKLDDDDLAVNDPGRRELAKIARVRYLVLGSVTRMGGITINARLVDATSGVVVQTGRISAPTPEKLLPLLPQLAQVLLMSDEEKFAFDAKQAAEAVAVAEPPAVIPPAPEPLQAGQPLPPPVIAPNPQAPVIGQMALQDFDQLPLMPEAGVAPPVIVMPQRPDPFRDRLLAISLQVGDNLFLRGRHADALRQFELALSLSGGRGDIRIRIARCQPFLPPAVVVVPVFPVVPPPVIFLRPRVAVLPFVVHHHPPLPGFGNWVADAFAWQLGPQYELVDRGELYWYMGRMGMSVRDVLHDPWARVNLGRALGVRYFVFGFVDQTASFNVRTFMVDAETGYRYGQGFIHVHDRWEMKLRMGELARQMLCDPRDRPRFFRESEELEVWVVDARRFVSQGRFDLAIQLSRKGLDRRPNHAGFLSLMREAEEGERRHRLDTNRRRDFGLMQQQLVDSRVKQELLGRQAEEARRQAERQARLRNEAEQKLQEEKRDRAFNQLLAQARQSQNRKQYDQAVELFQSAVALKGSDDVYREIGKAKALAQQDSKQRADELLAQKQAERLKKEADEVARVRGQLEKDRKEREAEELVRKKNQLARDQAAHDKLLANAKKLLAENKFNDAIAAAQSAIQLVNSEDGRQVLRQAIDKQTDAKQSDKEREDLAKRLAEEKIKREAEGKQKQEGYSQALAAAQKALAGKQYDDAVVQYNAALKFIRTDAALNGLRQAEQALARDKSQADADAKQKADELKRQAQVQQLLAVGQKSLDAKQFDQAIKALNEAKKLAPANADVLAALSKAEAGRSQELADQKNTQERQARFKTLVKQAQADLAAKKFSDAIAKLDDAARINPGDPTVQTLLKQARDGQSGEADVKKTDGEYQKLLSQGQQALSGNQFDLAIQAFTAAQKLRPNDTTVVALLRKAEKAKADAAIVAKQQEDKQRDAQVQKLLQQGRTALATKNFTAAAQAFNAAAKLDPQDAEVQKALAELQKAQTAEVDTKKIDAMVAQLLQQGRAALVKKDYTTAAQAFNAAAKLDPRDAEVQKALAELQKAQTAEVDAKKIDAQVSQLLQQGRAALVKKDYTAAAQAFNAAAKLDPRDAEVQKALGELQKAQTAEVDVKKIDAQVSQLLQQGRAALLKKDYTAAAQAFNAAAKLDPRDAEVQKALAELQKAQTAETDAKKIDAQISQLLQQGRAALVKKDYSAAAQAFQAAAKLDPKDPDVNRALGELQKAQAATQAEADAKKIGAQVAVLLQQGRTALAQKNFAAAAQAFQAAAKLDPKDPDVNRALGELQKAQAAAQAAQAQADAKKIDAMVLQLLQQGRAALAQKNFAGAAQAFQAATKLDPKDPEVAKALAELQKAQTAAQADAEAAKNRLAAQGLVQKAQQAMAGKQYDTALQLLAQADKLAPTDPQIDGLIRKVQELKKEADAIEAKRKLEEEKRRQAYASNIKQGQAAMQAKRFDEAVRSFQEALKIIPGDATATQLLAAAQKALQDSKIPPKKDPPKKDPGPDPKVQAQFNQYMTNGQRLLAAKKFAEAANEFEAALKLMPDNAQAKQLLQQARQKK